MLVIDVIANTFGDHIISLKNNIPEHELTEKDLEQYGNLLLPRFREKLNSASLTEREKVLLQKLAEKVNRQFDFREALFSTENEAEEWMEKHCALVNAIQEIIESDYHWVKSSE